MNRILIIEDEQELLEEIVTILKYEQFETIETTNGDDGIRLAIENRPDLILCDILMSGTDGFEVLTKIKENLNTALIPFIFITALAERKNLRKGMEMGADDYLVKPFHRVELLKTIKTRIKKYKETFNKIKELKDKIIYSIPYEMRTSLNAILGFSKIMKKDADVLSKNDIAEVGNAIYRSGNRLYGMVKKFLMFIDVELNKDRMVLSKVHINQEKIREFAGKIAEEFNRTDDLKVEFPELVLTVSREWLFFALNEIINNAFKFSRQGQKVTVKAKKKEKIVELSIRDQGIGFPDNYPEKINAFVHFDSKTFEPKGEGLGLFLSRQIILIHGGQMYVDSSKQTGSVINIKFPL